MKRVPLLLADGFEAFEAAAFTDVLGWVSVFGSEPIEVVAVGMHPRLKCAFALEVVPAARLSEVKLEEFDAVAIPGGLEKAGFYRDAYSEVIRRFSRLSKPVASTCAGALPVGRSGVLGGRRAMTYHLLGIDVGRGWWRWEPTLCTHGWFGAGTSSLRHPRPRRSMWRSLSLRVSLLAGTP
jgi:4-methyl-5(b-hydroxyethyl)-thiazole monophosphate biosynthesis